MKMDLRAYGGNGYGHILTTAVPRLVHAGLSGEALQQILVENPRRLLTLRLEPQKIEEIMQRRPFPLHVPPAYPADDLRAIARNTHRL